VRPTLTERFAIPERGMMKRNEPKSENEAENADWAVLPVSRLPLWVFLLASCFPASPRDAIPSAYRLPRPRCGLAMTQKWHVLIQKQMFWVKCRRFRLKSTSRFCTNLAMTRNWDGFVWKTDVFCLMRPFCAVLLRIVFLNVSSSFFKRFVPKTVLFSNKTYQICHCEEGACARRGNLKRNETASRNEARQSPCNDIQSAAV